MSSSSGASTSTSLPQFDTTYYSSQIFWLVVALLVLVLFIKIVIVPRVTGVTSNRRAHIDDIDQCNRDLRSKNEDVVRQINDIVSQADLDAQLIVDEANKERELYISNKTSMVERVTSENIALYTKQQNDSLLQAINSVRDDIDGLVSLALTKLIK